MITIKDVALDAGVSTATVSRVLNGDTKVLQNTREVVQNSIDKLGYRIYPSARNLKKGKSHTIGVIVPELANYFFMQMLDYFEQLLRKQGYSMLLCSSNDDVEEEIEMLNHLQSQFVDGIIAIPVSLERAHFEQVLQKTPIVFVDRSFKDINADSILVDNIEGTFEVISALIRDGYKRIAFLGGDNNFMTSNERFSGYKKALASANIPLDEKLVFMQGTSMHAGYEAMDSILKQCAKRNIFKVISDDNQADAFFCMNLMVLHGATKRIMEENEQVQQSIVGATFDEIFYDNLFSWCKYFVSQPIQGMCSTAVKMIIDRVENPRSSEFQEIRFPTKIIKHEEKIWKHA